MNLFLGIVSLFNVWIISFLFVSFLIFINCDILNLIFKYVFILFNNNEYI